MTTEEWRPVVGWGHLYEVSNQGRVRSLDRMTPDMAPQGGVGPDANAGHVRQPVLSTQWIALRNGRDYD